MTFLKTSKLKLEQVCMFVGTAMHDDVNGYKNGRDRLNFDACLDEG